MTTHKNKQECERMAWAVVQKEKKKEAQARNEKQKKS
jgi:hypothetical protein